MSAWASARHHVQHCLHTCKTAHPTLDLASRNCITSHGRGCYFGEPLFCWRSHWRLRSGPCLCLCLICARVCVCVCVCVCLRVFAPMYTLLAIQRLFCIVFFYIPSGLRPDRRGLGDFCSNSVFFRMPQQLCLDVGFSCCGTHCVVSCVLRIDSIFCKVRSPTRQKTQ